MDPEVPTANGQLPDEDMYRERSGSVHDRFRLTPNCCHKQPARPTSLFFVTEGDRKPFLILFSESDREECSSGHNDAPGRQVLGAIAKLRLHKIFWSQNLNLQSQNATMRPDFSSPAQILHSQIIVVTIRYTISAFFKFRWPSFCFLLPLQEPETGSQYSRLTPATFSTTT